MRCIDSVRNFTGNTLTKMLDLTRSLMRNIIAYEDRVRMLEVLVESALSSKTDNKRIRPPMNPHINSTCSRVIK